MSWSPARVTLLLPMHHARGKSGSAHDALGDITTDLVADGYGIDMRPWARNELCIVGPPDDPAHVRGMTNGAAALRKIAEAKAHFVDAC